MVTHDPAIAAQADRIVRLAVDGSKTCDGWQCGLRDPIHAYCYCFLPDDHGFKIYIDGKLYDKEDAKISVYDHGLLYGDGVFEGIRSYGGKVFRMQAHLDRLWNSAKAILADHPHDQGARWPAPSRRPWRSTASRTATSAWSSPAASGTLGLDPNHCGNPQVIIITDYISLYPEELYRKGLEIVTVSVARNHPAALSPRIKSLNYLNNILAKIEGQQAGCVEALMLNHKGEVAECTGDNIFLVRDGALLTPPDGSRHPGRRSPATP